MAVVAIDTDAQSAFVATWLNLSASDTGVPWGMGGQTDKTATVVGAGGSFALQGSNDLSNWFTLHDVDMTTTITTSGIYVIKENPLFIRPSGAATSVIITAR